jgi:O-antigen ligase
MIVSTLLTGGTIGLSSAGATSLELLAGYAAARAFVASESALDAFIGILKVIVIVAVLLGLADLISSRWVSHEIAGAIFGVAPLSPIFRNDVIRATSTFDHPILFGAFCAFASAIFLFWETSVSRKVFYSTLCLFGCFLSQSSASLMCFVLIHGAYVYEQVLGKVRGRWALFWMAIAGLLAVVIAVSNHPLGWVISHLTFDPESGYYRILIWEAALDRIAQSPYLGFTIDSFDDQILDATIDSVWLVDALRFGVPAIILLVMVNLAAGLPVPSRDARNASKDTVKRMHLAFTIVLLMFIFSGLTVHFWNYIWIFWGVMIGITASLREMALTSAKQVPRTNRVRQWQAMTR